MRTSSRLRNEVVGERSLIDRRSCAAKCEGASNDQVKLIEKSTFNEGAFDSGAETKFTC